MKLKRSSNKDRGIVSIKKATKTIGGFFVTYQVLQVIV
ncbi:hypothetical protein CZ794_00490 [Psychrobacter sp. JB385]|nr:hypothetical protein CZ794_00490 [Psychrobacter sp. JB385]